MGECKDCELYQTLSDDKHSCGDPKCFSVVKRNFIKPDGTCQDCGMNQITDDDKQKCKECPGRNNVNMLLGTCF